MLDAFRLIKQLFLIYDLVGILANIYLNKRDNSIYLLEI